MASVLGGQAITTGGKRFPQLLRRASSAQKQDIAVGFFATARYHAGRVTNRPGHVRSSAEPVARIAAAHEFGIGVPERPFFRQALPNIEARTQALAAKAAQANQGLIPDAALGAMGELAASLVQQSITRLRKPPLSAKTIAVKGSSNPLIDTGFMRSVVAWEIR